ncbi:hypothetical protein ACFRAU_22405 [Arthrobacter sp. NPDC056691]|uniref:hypothetical protein n=1 Tax=Arthrobacter sp. NPDC056691 TaxID=3345913 RepID=UPI0036719F2A
MSSSWSRSSTEGLVQISWTRDTVGVLAGSVTDIAAIDDVLTSNERLFMRLDASVQPSLIWTPGSSSAWWMAGPHGSRRVAPQTPAGMAALARQSGIRGELVRGTCLPVGKAALEPEQGFCDFLTDAVCEWSHICSQEFGASPAHIIVEFNRARYAHNDEEANLTVYTPG